MFTIDGVFLRNFIENLTVDTKTSLKMKGTEVPNPWRSSALVSCPDYFSPSGSEKYGLGTKLAVHVIVLVCEVMRLDHTFWPFRDFYATFCFVPAYAKSAHEFLTLFHRPCATYL